MVYHKWIFDKEIVLKIWHEKYLKMVGIPNEILEIQNPSLKEKISEMWQFIHVNFSEDLQGGVEAKSLRNAMYRYITENYYEDMKNLSEVLKWFSEKDLLNLYNASVEEQFIKKPVKKQEKK